MSSTASSGALAPAPAVPAGQPRRRSLGRSLRRLGVMAVGLACLGLALLLLLPFLLIGLLVVLVVVGTALIGSALQGRALPADDGRRNVRVRPPADTPGS